MQIAETAMREVIGKSNMDSILYETQVDIANKSRDLMQEILDRYKTGITISTVTIQNAQPPEQVQAAFDDAVQGRPGPRAAEERGPGLRQRRDPARARHGARA